MKPKQIVFFIVLVLLALGAVCYFFPREGVKIGSADVQMPSVEEVLEMDSVAIEEEVAEEVAEDSVEVALADSTETVVTQEEPKAEESEAGVIVVVKDSAETNTDVTEKQEEATAAESGDSIEVEDTRVLLARFYESLRGTDTAAVRVVHYGDSQIEGDRMTMQVREGLQQQFGGGGVGMVPLHQTISMRTVSQTLKMNNIQQTAQQGPKRYLAYGPKSNRRENGVYGPMAQVAVMNNNVRTGSENIAVNLTLNRNAGVRGMTRIRIFGDKDSVINMSDTAYTYTLYIKRKGEIYGLSLETETGVMVDNVPMRGCAGTIFTSIDKQMLRHYYKATNTRLIIMQFGGNVMPYTHNKKDVEKYVERARRQVRYLQKCAPEADILFIGPSDMHTTINGSRVSYPILPTMDAALRQMAIEEKAAYWSLFEAMGGKGGMSQWKSAGLAGSDGVHFTRKGADKAGNMLTEWLLEGWQKHEEEATEEMKEDAEENAEEDAAEETAEGVKAGE